MSVDYEALDPGIRHVVEMLRDAGFDTSDSGDGETKVDALASGDALPYPHVFCIGRLASLVTDAHLMQELLGDEWTVEASYSAKNQIVILAAWTEQQAAARRQG